MELIDLYRQMARARTFEMALHDLWHRGLISGEMHLGTGEEAVAAGVVSHLRDGDAMALDHRCTPPMIVRGIDLLLILKELLGHGDGLCGGRGGHMHLLSRDHLAAASGIVGSSAPLGAGLALAASHLRPGSVAVAFFGEGAMNQGMLLETLNLSVAWHLPLILVCKDNGWAITTLSRDVTGGELAERANACGMPSERVNGLDPVEVWNSAGEIVTRVRDGHGPFFLHATCSRLDGHFLGDLTIRIAKRPLSEGRSQIGNIATSILRLGGAGLKSKLTGVREISGILEKVKEDRREGPMDPLFIARQNLEKEGKGSEAEEIAVECRTEIEGVVRTALAGDTD